MYWEYFNSLPYNHITIRVIQKYIFLNKIHKINLRLLWKLNFQIFWVYVDFYSQRFNRYTNYDDQFASGWRYHIPKPSSCTNLNEPWQSCTGWTCSWCCCHDVKFYSQTYGNLKRKSEREWTSLRVKCTVQVYLGTYFYIIG